MKQPDRSTSQIRSPATADPWPSVPEDGAHPDANEELLVFEDNRLASLVFGQYDQHLAKLERRLGIGTTAQGNRVILRGTADRCAKARSTLELLYQRVKQGHDISLGDVDGAIEETTAQGLLFKYSQENTRQIFAQISTRKRGPVRARNHTQNIYLNALKRNELVLAEGPAGTGKTWLAVGYAVSLLEAGVVERLIISRPAVEAGERLGFLPGDMKEKVDPYLRPIYDALFDFMDTRQVERGMQTGMIEVAPLAFMRGRTLAKACILLDEAQNTSSMQMKMFLTRLGEGSRMIVTGDPTQIDLPPGQRSGFKEAINLLANLESVGHVRFQDVDVVRHDLVRRIVGAYDRAAKNISSPKRLSEDIPPL